jgi:hypothetical protein
MNSMRGQWKQWLIPVGLTLLTIASVIFVLESDGTRGGSTGEPEKTLAQMTVVTQPALSGPLRFGKKLSFISPKVSEAEGVTFATQWLRDGKPIEGATELDYRTGIDDVGSTISVEIKATKSGFKPLTMKAEANGPIGHKRDRRVTVEYTIASRGDVLTASDEFAQNVAKILDDPRGWRSDGIEFKQVETGGDLTINLSTSAKVPSFSSTCSSYWSCRTGDNVVINEDRWLESTDTWKAAPGTTLAAYQHMVVNHEVGHWLGLSHSYCRSQGEKAPLMMQQSKGLNGCKPNPWPLESEMNPPRFR